MRRDGTAQPLAFPLRAGLERCWDDVWNLVHDRRQPTMEETAELETRFLDLLDELERRST